MSSSQQSNARVSRSWFGWGYPNRRPSRPGRPSARPAVESLETRAVPAVTSTFLASSGQLNVSGDAAHDRIALTSDAAGNIRLNGSTISGARLTTARAIVVSAGAGNDTVDLSGLTRFTGSVVIDGGLGNDTLTGSPSNDGIQGNVGDDVINAGAGNDTVYAYFGNDTVNGGDGHDWMHGDFDHDWLDGAAGNDTLYGGYGNDFLQGNVGNDLMDGQFGQDTLYAYYGNDTLYGGDGHDWMHGDFDHDLLEAGTGNDTVHGGLGNDHVHGQAGTDEVYGGPGHDVVTGAEDNDWLQGDEGDDTLYGFAGDDALIGGAGNDALYGEYDNDWLDGGHGNDGLYGGPGADTLTGGPGADRFLDVTWTKKKLFGTDRYWEDNIKDANWREDAHVGFEHSTKGSNGFAAAFWSIVDIQAIDAALAVLHRATGNTKLLEKSDGGDVIFVRYGAAVSSEANGVTAWNAGGTIGMPDPAFANAHETLDTVFHEIGHNWDREFDGRRWDGLSGWTTADKSRDPANYTRGTDTKERWFYLNSAAFVNRFGRKNAYEDFAESFANYFMNAAGVRFARYTTDISRIPTKRAFLDNMVATLR